MGLPFEAQAQALLQSPGRLPQPTGSQGWRGCGEKASGFVRMPVCWRGRTSPDPLPQAILPQPRGGGGPRGGCLAWEGQTVPKDRHWLPPKAQGRKSWTKKRQPDGRGAKGKETQLGKEPKGAGGGWGPPGGRVGRGGHCQLGEEAQQPAGREGSPGASLPHSDGAGAARLPRRRGLRSGRVPVGQRPPG